jgi:MoxR-like ATPase
MSNTKITSSLDIFQAIRSTPLEHKEWQSKISSLRTVEGGDWTWEAQRYVAHPYVVDAVNVAIALGKPLLVTGEPGVGKSALANAIAWQLGLGRPEKFVAKSTSEATDLFYNYDALARFYAIEVSRHLKDATPEAKAQQPRRFLEPENARHFIDYQGLGRAILNAHDREDVADFLLEDTDDPQIYTRSGPKKKSVVLIDEIDKASSDFCNDLLDEFDKLQFRVPEIKSESTPFLDRAMRPIVIVTSNRERELPPAFLRRCTYAHIPRPERTPPGQTARDDEYRIENILKLRLDQDSVYSTFTMSVLDLVDDINKRQPGKTPSTAEIIELLLYCRERHVDWSGKITDSPEMYNFAVSVLSKTESDARMTRGVLTMSGKTE